MDSSDTVTSFTHSVRCAAPVLDGHVQPQVPVQISFCKALFRDLHGNEISLDVDARGSICPATGLSHDALPVARRRDQDS